MKNKLQLEQRLHWVESQMEELDNKDDFTQQDSRRYYSLEHEWDMLREELGLGYVVG